MLTLLTTLGKGEKGVDVSLAVDMLYLSTVPNAYDVAILVTGDKDFLPLIEKTRLNGKSVVLCSIERSCSRALYEQVADFRNIWLEDYLDELIVPSQTKPDIGDSIHDAVIDILKKQRGRKITGRNLGRKLSAAHKPAFAQIRDRGGLRFFLSEYSDFRIIDDAANLGENDFLVHLIDDEATIYDAVINILEQASGREMEVRQLGKILKATHRQSFEKVKDNGGLLKFLRGLDEMQVSDGTVLKNGDYTCTISLKNLEGQEKLEEQEEEEEENYKAEEDDEQQEEIEEREDEEEKSDEGEDDAPQEKVSSLRDWASALVGSDDNEEEEKAASMTERKKWREDDEGKAVSMTVATLEAYRAETVANLKELCRKRKLKVSGRKSELIQRLLVSGES